MSRARFGSVTQTDGAMGSAGDPKTRTASPVEIRAEFERLVVDDLYGPAGGESETLTDSTPSDRYLVGMLAPQGSPLAYDPEREEPDPADSGDEAPADPAAVKAAVFPSSKGLSFAVMSQVRSLRVRVSWGNYRREEGKVEASAPSDISRESAAAADDVPVIAPTAATSAIPPRVWQRYPVSEDVELVIPAGGGPIGRRDVSTDHPGVYLVGRATEAGGATLVSVFLVNAQIPKQRLKDEQWLFQAEFAVLSDGGEPVFLGRDALLRGEELLGSEDEAGELAQLEMLYRRSIEFAVGHGTAVHTTGSREDPTRAIRVETRSVPRYEVPRTDPPRPGEPGFPGLAATVLDMKVLSELSDSEVVDAVRPLVDGYREWLTDQNKRLQDPDLAEHREAAEQALLDADAIAARLQAALRFLERDKDACEAFRFANNAMWQQRVRTSAIALLRSGRAESIDEALSITDIPSNRSWRPFQIAFALLNLPSLTDPFDAERGEPGLVDLLFFPTGGGKTEAYLGLTAYTFAIRRLQGNRFGRDGSAGLAVLMRYTLRLLTAQQFQRAASLTAACEVRRRQLLNAGDQRWGDTPFRIGLWVGSSVTPNTAGAANQVVTKAHASGNVGAGQASPLQLTTCPWCGSLLSMGADVTADPALWRTLVYCSDPFGDCPFTSAGEQQTGVGREGIPVVTVDDEIYRLLPSLIISTADKFAQLPWQGSLHLLFGSVSRRCTRHGYRSPDLDVSGGHDERDSHPASGKLPRAKTVDVEPLRPPDLIIQDELHLISGPLGSLTGLYETAIDALASWQVDGRTVRPKVIASTATVRRAADQAHALFARQLSVFPPPVLDIENNYFSVQRSSRPDPNDSTLIWAPGRLYVGVCGFGRRLKSVQTRLFITLLAAGKRLFDKYGDDADPYMSVIGYYNSLRELAGGRRLVDDDVRSRLARAADRGLGRRTMRIVEELTSRKSSADIPATLDQLGQRFTTAGEDAYAKRRTARATNPKAGFDDDYRPIDVLLATNMISVGVDVQRLGLMATVGQPKASSEYIQATSRIGRDPAGPGIVFTIYNWARPRDLSHYESFEHYHATFYTQVEALSVTPFAPRAVDRGLTALLVAFVRHAQADGIGRTWNPEPGAQSVPAGDSAIEDMLQSIVRRAELVTTDPGVASAVEAKLRDRLSKWTHRQEHAAAVGATLGYRGKGGAAEPLLKIPPPGEWDEWSAPNSLRETEPNANLLIDLWDNSLTHAPTFQQAPDHEEATPESTLEDLDLDAAGAPTSDGETPVEANGADG